MNPLLANLKRHECFNKLFIESVINKQEFKRFKNAHFIEISGDNNPPTGENLLSACFNATTSDQQLGSAVQMLVNVTANLSQNMVRAFADGAMGHWIDPSWGGPMSVLHDWCNKGCGMCNPVCGMVHIKEPLLLIGKSSLCGGSGFPFSLSEWSLTICLTPYNRK